MTVTINGSTGIASPGGDTSTSLTTTTLTATNINSTGSTGSINSINTFGFKNRIINGGMTIDQRNAGASITPIDGQFSADRWKNGLTASSKYSVQQVTDAPSGFSNSLKFTSLSAYTILSNSEFEIFQPVEGFNFADMAWGTADAKAVTVSFWVKSSLTGLFGGSVANGSNYSCPFSYTINSANTWEYKSYTIPGPTAGTWVGATNGTYLQLFFSLGAGSSNIGTAGTWTGSFLKGATGQTNLVATNAATLYITGVQLEVGSQATSFDFRSIGQESILCYRYYEAGGGVVTATNAYYNFYYKVTKRTSATVTNTVAAGGSVSVGTADGVNQWYQNSNASALSTMSFTASAEL